MSMTFKDNSSAVLHEIKARAGNILHNIGPEIVKSAILLCPVDTGNLQRSIEPEYYGLSLRIGSRVPYAANVEGGTSKMAAQPYLVPALTGNLWRIKKAFKAI